MSQTESDQKPRRARRDDGLDYPFAERPATGSATEVAPGVLWIRMPLPYTLNHINLWALDDGDGWAIVDTGTRTPEVMDAWQKLLDGALAGRPVTRVFVTHMHPDHIGMAGWITRHFGCRLWITRLEYLNCRVLVGDTGREAPQDGVDFYRRAGWTDTAIETYRARFGNFGRHVYSLPDSYRRMRDGDTVRIGAHDWTVIVGTGHSPEHACLYNPSLNVLISGDQVLPRISSNVSVFPTEPDADPMADWLASIDKIRVAIDEHALVLPAHGDCFRGVRKRLDALEQGQEKVLDRLRRTIAEPKRVVDVFGALFARSIDHADVGLLGMATGEGIACLNYLVNRGEASVTTRPDGVSWYQMQAAAG
ncbi:MAG: MBL fold metallo-hydrolase [Burkholderiaceae bacterium]|nr:MBL fold metallo-hydrolase [Burkholderiaceae bacterium]